MLLQVAETGEAFMQTNERAAPTSDQRTAMRAVLDRPPPFRRFRRSGFVVSGFRGFGVSAFRASGFLGFGVSGVSLSGEGIADQGQNVRTLGVRLFLLSSFLARFAKGYRATVRRTFFKMTKRVSVGDDK